MRKMFVFSLSACVFSFLLLNPATVPAQEPENSADALIVYKDEIKTVATNTPTRVVIGNPVVADVVSVGAKEIVVAGKSAGMTNLFWWDSNGERSVRIKVLTEEMAYFKTRIDDLLTQMNFPNVTTKPADAEGKVLLTGSVKTAADLTQLMTALGDLAKKTVNLISVAEEEATVELDVEVLEVDQDGTKQLGLQWPGSLELAEPAAFDKTLAKTPDSLFHVSKWTHGTLTAKIDFLVSEGKARILSRPKLACQSGKEAELMVGGETPILTTQVVSGGATSASGTQVEYKEYGIKLKMAPVVTVDGRIKLVLKVEVSDLAESAMTLGGAGSVSAVAYPLIKRNTSTQLVLNDNQTLAISGLIKQQTSEDVRKTPFLGDLPIIGALFRHRDIKHGKGSGSRGDTELVVMVTPKILKSEAAPGVQSGASEGTAGAGKNQASGSAKPAAGTRGEPPDLMQPPQSEDAGRGAAFGDYTRQVADYISGRLVYPSMAKLSKIEGTVTLDLHVSSTGDLLETKVSKSSGYAVLDADALSTSKDISPYPGFPDAIGEKDIWIQVPISYKLTSR
jgi:pilus assembly protein CpaC